MPRWEVVDLALPSVEDQNLDGALAAEPRHHRLRAALACPARHEGPGDPRAVRDVRLPLLPAAQRHPRRAGRGRLRPARRQAPAPPPRPSPAGPLRPAVRRVRIPVTDIPAPGERRGTRARTGKASSSPGDDLALAGMSGRGGRDPEVPDRGLAGPPGSGGRDPEVPDRGLAGPPGSGGRDPEVPDRGLAGAPGSG